MAQKALLLALACFLTLPAPAASGGIFYVDFSATGADTGTSWQNAFTSIQSGIDAASGAGGGEVWVRAGVYNQLLGGTATDRFEFSNPDSVDIIGEEADFNYTSSSSTKTCHVTILYLTGDVTTEPQQVSWSSTDSHDSLATRLAAEVRERPDTLVFANHPSRPTNVISQEDLAAAANANALVAMEVVGPGKAVPADVSKWDYALAHLDDQAGDCSKIVWGISSDDYHSAAFVDFRVSGLMMGMIPTPAEDPVYADRRLAFKDMIRRGSIVALPSNCKCSIPTYVLRNASESSYGRLQVNLYVDNISGASSALMYFYGCDWDTGNTPGCMLGVAPVTLNAFNSVSYYLTYEGIDFPDEGLTPEQRANIKYVRPVLTWQVGDGFRSAYFQPVRIKSNGDWWNGPAYSLSGHQGTIGPSPYPVGGTDSGETVYFNTHSHSLASDGDSTPSTMRWQYLTNYGQLDPGKPCFDVLTDHGLDTPFTPPTQSIVTLKEGVHVYGGFAGTETSRDQRDWTATPTTIDGQSAGRCVFADGSGWTDRTNATIDGFVIKNGKVINGAGAGIRTWQSSPNVRNCTLTNNMAVYGGAICNSEAPTVADCTFSNNSAGGSKGVGGAMLNEGYSVPHITSCSFTGNVARKGNAMFNSTCASMIESCTFSSNVQTTYYGDGGAMYNLRSSSTITNCTFSDNKVRGRGGAMHNNGLPGPKVDRCTFTNNSSTAWYGGGGGMYNTGSSPVVTNCVFAGNVSNGPNAPGGGINCQGNSSPTLLNNTIAGNSAFLGGGIYCSGSSTAIINNIIAFNSGGIYATGCTPTLSCNDVYMNDQDYYGVLTGPGDISLDPVFVNRAAGNYHIQTGSSCINAGDNASPTLPATDMDGEDRIEGDIVDIGADECWLQATTVHSARVAPDNLWADIKAAVVTVAFPDFFYIEGDNRQAGIRVEKAGHGLSADVRADVTGTIHTNNDGERYIEATSAVQNGSGSVEPLFMLNRAAGGADWRYNPGSGGGQQGVKDSLDLNNIGLLICTTGTVTAAGSGYFYLDDGSKTKDDSGNVGVKVMINGFSIPPLGKHTKLTGISSCYTSDSDRYRLILVGRQADIMVLD